MIMGFFMVCAFMCTLLLAITRRKHSWLVALLLAGFSLCGIVVNVSPDVAHMLATGSGLPAYADISLHLLMLVLALVLFDLYAKLRELQESLTLLTRQISLERADKGSVTPS